jgi:hypothetical protein
VKVTIAAVAAATAAALSLVTAGTATGQPIAHHGQPKAAPQITGPRLRTGLLPASAFGANFTVENTLNTGGTLLSSTKVTLHVPTASCSTFEGEIYVSGFGNTAGALDQYVNPDAAMQRPEAVIDGLQDVVQFATTAAATTFLTQAQAKYAACLSFSEPNPTDTNPGGGTFQISTLSVAKTTVSGDQAFTVTEAIALSEKPGLTQYIDVLYVLASTNVYSMWQYSGTNDEPSAVLMAKLIRQVQALYPH